jgi:hypothetical protein
VLCFWIGNVYFGIDNFFEMKIKMTIEVEVEDTFNFTDEEEKMWFENEVLIGDGTLILHSNEIGDTVGIVKKVTNVKYFYSIKQ